MRRRATARFGTSQATRLWRSAILLTLAASTTPVSADALPFEGRGHAGQPALGVRITVSVQEGEVALTARARGPEARVVLPMRGAEEASLSEVELAGGARVLRVDVTGPSGQASALVVTRRGRAEVLWTGRTDAHGDPGERRSDVLQIADRNADDAPDVIVAVTSERHRVCGQRETLLFPRAVDPATLQLRPVVLRRLPEDSEELVLSATETSPGPTAAPMLTALRFATASSALGAPMNPELVPAPVALSDGDPASGWIEGHGDDGAWEFATAAWSGAPWGIRALAITPRPATTTGSATATRSAPPNEIFLVGDQGPRLRVTLPATTPGQVVWVTPPEPLPWRCLTIVLGPGAEGGRAGLAEISAYTELDFGDGMARLVADLAGADARAGEAARLLATLGLPAVTALTEQWDQRAPAERRLAVRVFAAQGRSHEEARDALALAARDPDEGVRGDALEALGEAGPDAADLLGELATAGPDPDAAAALLARRHPVRATALLLASLSAEGGTDRSALRDALRTAVQRGEAAARDSFTAWVATAPPIGPAAGATLALAGGGEPLDLLAASLVQASSPNAVEFDDRYRLVRASRRLPAEAGVDGWLAGLVREADEWMLRAAALEALAERESPLAQATARLALSHDYPRVRMAALTALASTISPDDDEPIARLARRDRWPMVRAEAVRAAGPRDTLSSIVRAAAGDRSRVVRTAAVEALTTRRDAEAAELVYQRLRDEDEWPDVIEASIRYAEALCLPESVDALAAVVARGLVPEAWAPDVDLAAAAVMVLAQLPGEVALDVLARAGRQGAPTQIGLAARRATELGGTCATSEQ